MSKPKARCYRLFGNVLTICCFEIEITCEKCYASKILGVMVNLLTRLFPVELDADCKKQKFEKCFA